MPGYDDHLTIEGLRAGGFGTWETRRQPRRSAEGRCHALDRLGEHGLAGTEVQPHKAATRRAESGPGLQRDAAALEEHITRLLAIADTSAVQPCEEGRLRRLPADIG